MKMSCVATVLITTLLTVGCGTEHSGGVAVVDLDRVAKELGRDTVMLQQLQQQQNGLNQKLASVKTSFEAQLTENFEKLPEEPSEEEAAKLLNMKRNANIQLATYKQQATNALGQMKNSAIAGFRAETMPIARDVAKDRGMTIVLTTNDSVVFAFDKSIDITDDVIARMEKSAPKAVPVPATPAPTTPLKTTPAATPSEESTDSTSVDQGR